MEMPHGGCRTNSDKGLGRLGCEDTKNETHKKVDVCPFLHEETGSPHKSLEFHFSESLRQARRRTRMVRRSTYGGDAIFPSGPMPRHLHGLENKVNTCQYIMYMVLYGQYDVNTLYLNVNTYT